MAGLGEILQNTRLTRGISLEEAERATHISRRYLQALEAEDFSVFVAPVFARGFLRNYSQYLGLDPEEMLVLWPQATDAPVAEPEPQGTRTEFERRARPLRERQVRRRPVVTRGGELPSPLMRPSLPRSEPASASRVGLIIAALALVIAVVAFVASRAGRTRGSALTAGNAVPTVVASAAAPNQPRATPTPPPRRAGAMPNLVGKDLLSAMQQLQQAGVTPLVISVTSTNRSDRPGAIIRQQPAAGTSITTGTSVTLVVNQATAAPAPAGLPVTGTPAPARPPTAAPTRAATPTR